MKKFLFLFLGFVASHASAVELGCKYAELTGSFELIANGETLETSKQAVLLTIADRAPGGVYKQISYATEIFDGDDGLALVFSDGKVYSWRKRPKSENPDDCWVRNGTYTVVNLRKQKDGSYSGDFTVSTRIDVDPRVESCQLPPIPDPFVQKVSCTKL